jgi:thiamine-phosphate pyrophosphorylase
LDTEAFERRGFLPVEAARVVAEEGARILQYRHKAHFSEARFEEASRVSEICRANGTLFVMNDRVDFARLLNAAAHVGQMDLPPVAARSILGPDLRLGVSTHNERQFREALAMPADYIAIGPVFNTASKLNPDPVVGLEEVKRFRSLTALPIVGIGGITIEAASTLLDGAVNSVAVIGGMLPSTDGTLSALAEIVRNWIRATGAPCAKHQ